GHARNRIQALPPPGKAPYGYQRSSTGYSLDQQTAAIIKDFFDDYLLNGSLRQAVRCLEKRHGKIISTSTAQRWLTHPVYRGNLQYQNNQIIPHTHAPILSREEAAQIDRLLRRNRSFAPRTATAPHSLAGLVFCQTCSSVLTISQVKSRKGEKNYLYLRGLHCSQQPKCQAIAYEVMLNQVINQICQELPLAVRNSKAPNLSGIKQLIQQQIEQKEQVIKQLPTLVKQEILDQEMANLREYQLKIELAQLQQQLDQLPPGELSQIIKNVALPQFWLDLSEIERRFYFREFIREIQVIYSEIFPKEWKIQLNFVF
ncbi:MAG: recombinase family protein, partial [Microcystaceae cyanobacterium]